MTVFTKKKDKNRLKWQVEKNCSALREIFWNNKLKKEKLFKYRVTFLNI
jgi:hypothetical protein